MIINNAQSDFQFLVNSLSYFEFEWPGTYVASRSLSIYSLRVATRCNAMTFNVDKFTTWVARPERQSIRLFLRQLMTDTSRCFCILVHQSSLVRRWSPAWHVRLAWSRWWVDVTHTVASSASGTVVWQRQVAFGFVNNCNMNIDWSRSKRRQ